MSNSLDAILSQYESNTDNSSKKPKISNEDRLKKYFTEKLQQGMKNATRRFRILPAKDGKSPFEEAYFYERQVNGKYEKIYCNKLNDGEYCQIYEAKEALMMEGSKKAKEMAREYTPRKFYVVKGIDRDNEDHGVKFWRFKHNYTGNGVMDKLMPLFKLKGDITDAREGRDIIITTTPATSFLFGDNLVRPGTHVTAIGADTHGKQELPTSLIESASLLVCDMMSQSLNHGEFQVINDTYLSKKVVELGNILSNSCAGRTSDNDITIADLTGIAAQDIAITSGIIDAAAFGK